MNTKPNEVDGSNGVNEGQNRPAVPRAKLWIFFGLFFIVAVTMYATTMYRIQNYGYTGIGQDQLAHPEQDKAAAATKTN